MSNFFHVVSTAVICPAGFVPVYGGCYALSSMSLNWFDAAKACVDQGAYLVTFTSSAQNSWVYQFFASRPSMSNLVFWTGLTNIATSARALNFAWMDGTNSTYRSWVTNFPNSWYFDKSCVMANALYGTNTWRNDYCSNAYLAMCKWNETVSAPQGNLHMACVFCTAGFYLLHPFGLSLLSSQSPAQALYARRRSLTSPAVATSLPPTLTTGSTPLSPVRSRARTSPASTRWKSLAGCMSSTQHTPFLPVMSG